MLEIPKKYILDEQLRPFAVQISIAEYNELPNRSKLRGI
jgi:hypothetical protein